MSLLQRDVGGGAIPSRATILPLSVEVCTPVSETGRAGALPAAAANLISMKNKHQPSRATQEWRMLPRRSTWCVGGLCTPSGFGSASQIFYVRHPEQDDCAGA